MTNETLRTQALYSESRLAELREEVAKLVEDVNLDGLAIFAAGSFARLEASQYSDIDLFFTYHPSGRDIAHRRTNELKLFGRLIDLVDHLKFPPFSGDSRWLQTHDISEVLKHLGGQMDDAENYFTLRMLMILESKCVFGEPAYKDALESLVESYYRDFEGNESGFQPWFLINDIMRYWKTLLLNYESRRNDAVGRQEQTEARAKNFKLRFSRSTTCFATIAALASFDSGATSKDTYQLAILTPQERLAFVKDRIPATGAVVDQMLTEYAWFLSQTSLPKHELHALLEDSGARRSMFARAEAYGRLIYDLLREIDSARPTAPNLIRYLVV